MASVAHPEVKANDFTFFVQYETETDLDNLNMEGMLGLAPRDESSGPLFVEDLYF